MSKYTKALVALLGAIGTAYQVQYGHSHWGPTVQAVITVLLVFIAPNVDDANPKVPSSTP